MLAFVTLMLHWMYQPLAGPAAAWGLAALAAALLCASVVLHEFGHALVAQRYGLEVRAITLFALGGGTEISEAPPAPIRDLLIAAAGPVVSIALAALGGLLWWLLPAPFATLALHLALTNGVVALFNLLPAFPLDGGRIVWAVLYYLNDDAVGAAWVAALAGRVCGWLLLAAGMLYTFSAADVLNGSLASLIGYFLARHATIGFRGFVVQHALSALSVTDLMQRGFRAVAPELPLDEFVGRYVLGQLDQGFPVLLLPETDAPQPLLGMITMRNLRRFQFSEWARTRVGEAMTPLHRIRALPPGMPAGEAFRTLLESGEEQLPVIDGAVLLGMLRRRDLFGYIERQRKAQRP